MTRPEPLRVVVGLLRVLSSRDAANAAIGDILDEHAELTAAGQAPLYPSLWINTQALKALGASTMALLPRFFRTAGLTIRDAARALRHSPAQSLFITFILAVGIAAGTITFSVVDAVLLRPLPFDHPEELVSISTTDKTFKQRITLADFMALRKSSTTLQRVAASSTGSFEVVTVGDVTTDVTVTRTTSDRFDILHMSTALGRFWTAEDEASGHIDVAVVGYRFWKQKLQADSAVLDKVVSYGKKSYRVIGVLSEASNSSDFDLTVADVWIPMVMSAPNWRGGLLARMQPGATPADVAAEVQRASGSADWQPMVASPLDSYVVYVRDWMILALGAAGFVVVIACVNAANVMLTRATHRSQEMAIRASLGASRRQIVISVLAEGLLLSLAASACALLFAFWGVGLAKSAVVSLGIVFRASSIALNGRVLGAAVAAALVTGLLFSLVPAWQTSRTSVLTLLKDAGPTVAGGRRRWRSVFLVAEVASVGVLLVVSWLFVSSMVHSIGIDLGIDRTNLIAVKPNKEFQGTVDEVEARIRQIPGVSDVAVTAGGASLPLVGRAYGGAWITTSISRADVATEAPVKTLEYRVTPNYFDVSGLRFKRGATWTVESAAETPVTVLDEMVARQLFGNSDPMGQQVRVTEPAGIFTVAGIVTHMRARGPEDEDMTAAYFALKPNPTRTFAGLFVKTSTPAADVLPVIAGALKPYAPVDSRPWIVLAEDAVSRITAMRRFNAWLMFAFGCVGMLIAAAGIYAVMASIVAQQTREIGVRIALGATPQIIRRDVLGLAAKHLLVGLAIGLPAGWLVSRGSAALFFRVTPTDASVYVGVAMLLMVVGFAAVLIPARRASRVDPITSLRA
jgi:putative ABC transport system permease protein